MTKAGDKLPRSRKTQVVPSGRALGTKGANTRRRIIEATEQLLRTHRLRDISVADIARQAKTSPATFYVYFKTVYDVVLAALQVVTQSTPQTLGLLQKEWTQDKAYEYAHELVTSYIDHFQQHRDLFRVRNLAAEEGDEEITRMRRLATQPMLDELYRCIRKRQEMTGETTGKNPASTAGVLVAMLDRISSVMELYFEPGSRLPSPNKLHRADMIDSAAHIFALALALPASASPAPSKTEMTDSA